MVCGSGWGVQTCAQIDTGVGVWAISQCYARSLSGPQGLSDRQLGIRAGGWLSFYLLLKPLQWPGPFSRHMDDRFRVSVWPDGPDGVFNPAQTHQHLVRVLASSRPVPTRQFWFVDRPVHRGIFTRSVHSPQVSSIHPLSTELAGGLVLNVPSPSIVTSLQWMCQSRVGATNTNPASMACWSTNSVLP